MVNILPNSKLQTIKESAFAYTWIGSFSIPPCLTYIDENVFYCEKIQIVEIDDNCILEFNEINELYI